MSDENQQEPTQMVPTEASETQVEQPQETFDRDYVRKVREEAKANRTRAQAAEKALEEYKKAAEREKLDEVERLKAEKADAENALAQEREARTSAERMASLTGKVADPVAALKLLDTTKHLNEDGTVNTEALLADYSFLTPAAARVDIPAVRSGNAGDGPLSPEDFRGKSSEWIDQNLHRLRKK